MSTAPVETIKPQTVGATIFADQDLPLEQRTDVTVDELEKMSLPMPAELYNGKVVFKMASHVHSVIQATVAGEIYIYLKQQPLGVVTTDENYRLWPERSNQEFQMWHLSRNNVCLKTVAIICLLLPTSPWKFCRRPTALRPRWKRLTNICGKGRRSSGLSSPARGKFSCVRRRVNTR